MAKQTIKIESILGGQSVFENYAANSQFGESLAIDPDLPSTSGGTKSSGFLAPVPVTKVSSTTITNPPMWIVSNPKTVLNYVYDNGGKVYSMTSSGVVSTSSKTLSSAVGNGGAYYDNYMYFTTSADVARYGPLNGTATWTTGYWTGLSLSALDSGITTYPTAIRPAIKYPNHPMHVHENSNKLYFGDVYHGQGILNYIKTSKTTVEGDTNNGSTFNALDFPYGWWPIDIESFGDELAIAIFNGNATGANTGKRAKVVFWDEAGGAASWNREAELPDEICSALLNVNGVLYAFSGNLGASGVRVSRYLGGATFDEVMFLQDSCAPFAGAVDHNMNRVFFGGYADHLGDYACIWALGSKIKGFAQSLFNVMRFSGTAGTSAGTTSLALSGNNGFLAPKPFLGWSDGTNKGIDLPNTTYGVSTWRSETYRIGMPFKITQIRIPLSQAITSNMTLIPTLYMDDRSGNSALTTINSTNYAASERNIIYRNLEIYGKHNFMLELTWSGSSLLTVGLPIKITLETLTE